MIFPNNNYKFIFLLCIFINPRQLIADQCPTPEIIKERKISRNYEWTIDERRSLDDVLSVEKLYSVRIKNNGEYIACYYSGSKNLLRLDGKPLKQSCQVIKISASWELAGNGEQVCKEDDPGLCKYDMNCDESDRINE
jgi:hypothetical protein